jgi:hypothetical protein
MLHVLVAEQRAAYVEWERIRAIWWSAAKLDRPGAMLRSLAPQMDAAKARFDATSRPLSGAITIGS